MLVVLQDAFLQEVQLLFGFSILVCVFLRAHLVAGFILSERQLRDEKQGTVLVDQDILQH